MSPPLRRRTCPGAAAEMSNLARALAFHRACGEAGLAAGARERAEQAAAVSSLADVLRCLLQL